MAQNIQDEFYGQQAREHDDTYDVKKVSPFVLVDGNLVRQEGQPATEAKQDALSLYKISDTYGAYYGYLKADGGWYIMRETVSGDATAYRYASGASDYSSNWAARESLSYGYFSETF